MNPGVTEVRAVDDQHLHLHFTNGAQRRLDLRPCLAYPVFERLREPSFFAMAQPDHGTVSWPGGIGLDPDSVYLESVPIVHTASA